MNCPKCGAEIPDDAAFCGNCACDISQALTEQKCAEDKTEPEKKKTALRFGGKKKKSDKKDKPENNKKLLRIVIAAVVVIAIVAVIIYVLSVFSVSAGEKVTRNVPLGRDIDYVETKAGVDFTTASKYASLKNVASYDYVCESDNGIKIDGIHLPEWTVMLGLSGDKTVNRVVYYDFSQLQKSWKGDQHKEEIASGTVIYGMKESAVGKALGMKPYTIIKDIDNTSTYVYRYCYPEAETGNTIVCNYFVVFDDIDGTVKDVHSSVIDYCGTMLKVQ